MELTVLSLLVSFSGGREENQMSWVDWGWSVRLGLGGRMRGGIANLSSELGKGGVKAYVDGGGVIARLRVDSLAEEAGWL